MSDSGSNSASGPGHSHSQSHAAPSHTAASTVFTPEFGEIQLSLQEGRELQTLAHHLVQETVAEYTEFTQKQDRRVNNKVWKAVKSKESFTVYRDRRNAVDRAYASASSVIRPDDYTMPPLLGVGAIVGAVEDIMYGLATYAQTDMQWKSAQQQGEEMNGKTLFEIQTPSIDDPFRHLGIRWSLLGHNSLTSVVLHDLVILVGTGMELMPNGGYIGYQLTHSIQLPECPELSENNILRSRMSCCSLFRQQPHGNVEVYTKTYIEPSPNVPYSFALASTVSSMVDVLKTVEAGKDRKLARMLRDAKQRFAEGAEKPVLAKDASGNNCCGLCRKCFRMYNTIVTCQLCYAMVCSRCHVSRQVRLADADGNLDKKKVALCKNCVATIAKADASKIATKDFLGREHQRRRSGGSQPSLNEKAIAQLCGSTYSSSSPSLVQSSHSMDKALLPFQHTTSSGYSDPSTIEPTGGNINLLGVGTQSIEQIDDVDPTYSMPASFDVKLPKQQPNRMQQPDGYYAQGPGMQGNPGYPQGAGGMYDANYGGPRSAGHPPHSGGYSHSANYPAGSNYTPTSGTSSGYSHSAGAYDPSYGPPQNVGYPPNAGYPTNSAGYQQPGYDPTYGRAGAAYAPDAVQYGHQQPMLVQEQQMVPHGQPMPMPPQNMMPRGQPMQMPAQSMPMPPQQQQGHSHEEELWMRMNKLRVAAEEAYKMAKQNGDAMRMDVRVQD